MPRKTTSNWRQIRAEDCFTAAREEIEAIRKYNEPKSTGVNLARGYVRQGRKYLYTNERVTWNPYLKPNFRNA